MNASRRPLIAGNWKMFHGGASGVELAEACAGLAKEMTGVDIVIAPPFTALAAAAHSADGTPLGIAAQNMHAKENGAFTGEISSAMLLESGCTWVILGHSERRQYFGETSEGVAEKTRVAIEKNLRPIVCVGETLKEREAGEVEAVLLAQLSPVLAVLKNRVTSKSASSKDRAGGAVIAYEPVWAIGTGKNAGPKEAEEAHAFIRKLLKGASSDLEPLRILYGGSLKPDNANSLFACPNVDGGLIGGASLDVAAFSAIARAANAAVRNN